MLQRSGVDPNHINRLLRSYVDGKLVTAFQDEGEEVKVITLPKQKNWESIDDLLRQPVALPGGRSISMNELVDATYTTGQQDIKHYNFRRSITLESDIFKDKNDTIAANKLIQEELNRIKTDYPNIGLDFEGLLDDIQESMDQIWKLFIFGKGVMYIILSTQFRSYWQPFMILVTMPLAFTGAVLGRLLTANPLSLYTPVWCHGIGGDFRQYDDCSYLCGRLRDGMGLLHATIYTACRRVTPILITSLTTIAGLFSLAVGLAGKSLIWGPVATAILAFSTILTLIAIPLLYRFFRAHSYRVKGWQVRQQKIDTHATNTGAN